MWEATITITFSKVPDGNGKDNSTWSEGHHHNSRSIGAWVLP
jgi:hypothetical protein